MHGKPGIPAHHSTSGTCITLMINLNNYINIIIDAFKLFRNKDQVDVNLFVKQDWYFIKSGHSGVCSRLLPKKIRTGRSIGAGPVVTYLLTL